MAIHFNSSDSEYRPAVSTATDLDTPWQVVVYNDSVNLMSYVVMVFCRVFGYDKEKSSRHMREVHEMGKSVVWTGVREKAENYVYLLQQWQLNAGLRREDGSF